MKTILFSDLVPVSYRDGFLKKVIEISEKLAINPDWLMLTMRIESAGTLSPHIRNAKSGATGLIQFMPSTAKGLGTTTAILAKLSAVDQLDWVYKYLKPYTGKMKSFEDVYLAVFFPVAIGKAGDYVLKTNSLSAQKVASWNPAYDLNNDGVIQKKEIRIKIMTFLPKNYIV